MIDRDKTSTTIWHRKPRSGRGFSLVELMIAMVILAIGILATMAMQFSSLNAYTSAREMTGASDMARTVEQIIRAEAWGMDDSGTPPAAAPFQNRNAILPQIVGSGGTWVRPNGFEAPVSGRMNDDDSLDDSARRFCIYVAAQESPSEPGYFRVGIAVVYPSARGQFPNVSENNPFGLCPAAGEVALDLEDQQELELLGLRVTRISTAFKVFET